MELTWADERTDLDRLVPLAQAVAATGGAVGWLEVPLPDEVRAVFARMLGAGSKLVLAELDGAVVGCGTWTRLQGVVVGGMASINKVMTHPDVRGRGVADAVVGALVEASRAAGVELLTLDVRGNNHGAQRLYARHGFVVTGRRPDALRVGDLRFDSVLMHRDLRTGTEPWVRCGSRHVGPGRT